MEIKTDLLFIYSAQKGLLGILEHGRYKWNYLTKLWLECVCARACVFEQLS